MIGEVVLTNMGKIVIVRKIVLNPIILNCMDIVGAMGIVV